MTWWTNRSTRRPTDDVCRDDQGRGCGRPLPSPVPKPGWTPPQRRKTDRQPERRQQRLSNEEWYRAARGPFTEQRAAMVAALPQLIEAGQRRQEEKASGQPSLFRSDP